MRSWVIIYTKFLRRKKFAYDTFILVDDIANNVLYEKAYKCLETD